MVGSPALLGPTRTLLPPFLVNLAWTSALLAAAALGGLDALVAYYVGPGPAAVLPLAGVVLVATWVRPVVGLCLAVLAVPFEGFSVGLGAIGLSPTELLLLLTAGVVVAHVALGRGFGAVDPVHLAFGGMILAVLTGLLVATDSVIVVKTAVMWSVFAVASAALARMDIADVERMLTCVVIAGGILGALAIAGGADEVVMHGGEVATGRATGSFTQPNLLGFFLTLAVPPAIVLAGRGALLRRILLAGAGTAAAAGLVLTLSRTSILGTVVALAILLAWPSFRRMAVGALLLVLVVTAANFSAITESRQVTVVSERLGTLTDRSERGADPRFEIWQVAPRIASDHPLLGVGYGNFPVVSPHYGLLDSSRLPYDHAHNLFLTFAAEGGLVGLGALAIFLVVLIRTAIRVLRRRGSPAWPLGLGLVAALSGLAVVSLGDYPLGNNAIMATIVLYVGGLVSISRHVAHDGVGSSIGGGEAVAP